MSFVFLKILYINKSESGLNKHNLLLITPYSNQIAVVPRGGLTMDDTMINMKVEEI